MRKFIESEMLKLQKQSDDHSKSLENVLRQILTFTQTLVTEVASKEGTESTEHAVKGLLAVEDFIKKNIDISMINRDRVALLQSVIERYDKNKKISEKVKQDDGRKFRKVGEKPDSIRETREVKKNLALYDDEQEATLADS